MIGTVSIIIACILIGMAISVACFGTGGKRKNMFKDIYYSIEEVDGIAVTYTKTGEYSAILAMSNPVEKFSSDIDPYYDYNSMMSAICAALGEGYAIHKQDIFMRKIFHEEGAGNREFLSASYFKYFGKREYTDAITYLTITQENKKSSLMSYDPKKWKDFQIKITKVKDILDSRSIKAHWLNKQEACDYVDRFFCVEFAAKHAPKENYNVTDEAIEMGSRRMKIYSLVDVDCVNLPGMIRPFNNIEVNNTEMPVDLLTAIDSIPGADTVVFNQIIYMPNQKKELGALDKKKNRQASLPSPANLMAVEDIKKVQDIIARESKQLVYAHYNLMVVCPKEVDLQKPTNYIENIFSRMGIHISKRAYNQLELFVNSFPGNCYGMNPSYDRFITLSEPALCLMYKERIPHSEDSPLKVYYTDRQGVPVGIDITGKEGKVKMTDNSNFFCLGPSGSGKSFHMNSVVRQLWEQNTDVVMVDTGNSYEGLCEYVGGKYIAYTEQKPITMNPFNITASERNIEKINFLSNLVIQIWKGSDNAPTRTETNVVQQIIEEYYDNFFNGPRGYNETVRRTIKNGMLNEIANKDINQIVAETLDQSGSVEKKIDALLDSLEARRLALRVESLSFNTFFEFAVEAMAIICTEKCIPNVEGKGIRPSDFRSQLLAFYKGGKYEKTLNEQSDTSLFDETFIVFEIDAIKEDTVLFPIVTLIIMDVFLQKMRLKKNRKVLVIEEAWKAIATPTMAEYIKYMYKTCRKFWGMVGVVTQELQDIISSPIVKEAIINNSDIFMLLDQSKFKERFGDIKAVLGLTDVDCKKIFTINRLDNKAGRSFFPEVFVRRGAVSGVYGVEEPRECYMTYTTERAEKEALKLYKRELKCTHQQAIEQYCKDWNASGIDKSLAFAQKVNAAGKVLYLDSRPRQVSA